MRKLVLIAMAVFLTAGLFGGLGCKSKESADVRQIKNIVTAGVTELNKLLGVNYKIREVRVTISRANPNYAEAYTIYTDGSSDTFILEKKGGKWEVVSSKVDRNTPPPEPTSTPRPLPAAEKERAIAVVRKFFQALESLDVEKIVNLVVPEKREGFRRALRNAIQIQEVTLVKIFYLDVRISNQETNTQLLITSSYEFGFMAKDGEGNASTKAYFYTEKRNGDWLIFSIDDWKAFNYNWGNALK